MRTKIAIGCYADRLKPKCKLKKKGKEKYLEYYAKIINRPVAS
jgi:hypothetical protein